METNSGTVRSHVLERWQRCHALFGRQQRIPTMLHLSDEQLQYLQQNNYVLLRAARQYVNSLFNHLNDLDCAVLVCDAKGWLIEVMDSAKFKREFKRIGIRPGANVSEVYIGNSAIGSALSTRELTSFHSFEHYFEDFHRISASGAPVLLNNGSRLLGAISFVTFGSSVDAYLPPLVQSASIAIANAIQLEEYRQDILRVHQSLISQLDYHVILTDSEQEIIDERHPVPLTKEAQQGMVSLTQQGEFSDEERVLCGRTYRIDVRNLWDHKGEFKGKLGLFRDVTRSKQMESRVRDAEKVWVLNSLAAGIAHEIRNPLTTARGFLQLFSERIHDAQDKRYLDLTIEELDRINLLVKDFMSLAKPEKPQYGQIDIAHTLASISHLLYPEAALRGISLEVIVPEHETWIWADENQIKQVILNLVQNALQACTIRNSVTVFTSVDTDYIEIHVVDDGCGMTQSQIDRVFQPFYTTKESGTGLGLAICKRIIDEHSGKIKIESTVGRGTTVRIQLKRI